MKITALLRDDLVEEVKKFTGGKNITQSLTIALEAYTRSQRLLKTLEKIKKQPLKFADGYSAEKVRELNRQV